MVDLLLASLLTTVQPPDDDVLSETERKSDNEVTIVSFQLVPVLRSHVGAAVG